MTRHFLDLKDVQPRDLRAIIDGAKALKAARRAGNEARPLAGKTLAMIFEKPSTRTRVSFECAIRQLGGDAVVLNAGDMQIGRGESIHDTAKVLSRYVDAIMIRCFSHDLLMGLAEHATVPVINGLTDRSHPCQLMADVMTYEEHKGDIAGSTLAWVGDGNNVAVSLIEAAKQFDFHVRVGTPNELSPPPETVAWAGDGVVTLTDNADDAVAGADAVFADTWVSMGDKDAANRHNLLAPFQVNDRLMSLADKDALFLHCLPAHRNEEVTNSVMDGPQSVVFDEAENRLHAQKAVLAWCLGALS
ncbi:MAG: ornithine carbamoyltransferase [Kiloniella sp.]|nr:ornithine carbamoyltransferase [Kiloniella sp.]RZO32744.1 MAG: ornithine carbamoyltransferase [Rhodospirillaceae bacterium]